MSEKNYVQTPILLELSKNPDIRLFRNNVGHGVVGKIQRLGGGEFYVRAGREMPFGLCVGSSDLFGWRSMTITPDMVGQKIAVVLAPECKPAKGGEIREKQIHFLQTVREAGGLAGICRSVDDAIMLCQMPLLGGKP